MSDKRVVVATGGKQYLVAPGDTITVERLTAETGASVTLTDLIAGKTVTAKVVEHGLGDKVTVLKFRPKTRYLRRRGHRQPYTKLTIEAVA